MCKAKKLTRDIIIAIAVSCFIVWYALAQLMFCKVANIDYIGNAYESAIRMAFGEEEEYQKRRYETAVRNASRDIPEGAIGKCTHDVMDNGTPVKRCSYRMPHVDRYDLYANHCAPWRFQKCATLRLDKKYFKDQILFKKVIDVINHPCSYHVDKETFLLEKEKIDIELKKFDKNGKRQWSNIASDLERRLFLVRNYIMNANLLGCRADQRDPVYTTKLIIGFTGDIEGKNIIIKHVPVYTRE
jgi:hypothetical protein